MLLLLLLLTNDENAAKYIHFYFLVLKTDSERKFFMENFNDQAIKSILSRLTDLFIEHPFNALEIEKYLSGHLFLNNTNQKTLTKYQVEFYKNIQKEYTKTGSSIHYNTLVNNGNHSFRFMFSEDETELELRFMDLYFEANKDKMNEKEQNDFWFKRVLKSAFD
jgi:hypothetical protein